MPFLYHSICNLKSCDRARVLTHGNLFHIRKAILSEERSLAISWIHPIRKLKTNWNVIQRLLVYDGCDH